MTADFTGRVALVTGAGKGLGRAYALWLAQRGAKLVVNNRKHDGLPSSAEAVVEEIRQLGGEAVADHSPAGDDESAAHSMIETALSNFEKLDILVCNAGIAEDVIVQDMSADSLRKMMDINFYGTVHALRAAIPTMLDRKYGRVVFSISQAALFGQVRSAHYCASKAALIGFARGAGIDLKPSRNGGADIRINCVAPAAFTPMSKRMLDEKWADFMSPFKVAPVVGYLCSENCNESGMIFNAGAGRVRRARIMETLPVEIPDEDFSFCLAQLDDMSGALEAISSFDSGAVLMPEMFE